MVRTPLATPIRRGAIAAVLAALLAGCGAAWPGSGADPGLALAAPAPERGAGLDESGDAEGAENVPTATPLAIPAEPEQPARPPVPGEGRFAGEIRPFSVAFNAPQDGEGVLALTARGIGTDWGEVGRESAVVTVYLDGTYNQDLILHRGETPAMYRALLGPIARGNHRIEVRYRPELSPPGARGAEISGLDAEIRAPGDPEYDAIAGAPILYARPDANRSDTPLFMAYQRLATGLKYTLYASNEDGGTPPADLMAVWGRACDIDWVYRQSATGSGGYIQGFLHRTLAFRGRFEGKHPVLRIATNNNMVSDQGSSRFKLRPFVVPAADGSRERLLDLNPWVYRLTAVELAREGKIRQPGERESLMGHFLGKKMGDMRRYVTIEFEHPGKEKLGFRLRLEGTPDWHLSTGGRFWRAIRRGGVVRTTIELPAGATASRIAAIEPITASGKPFGGNVRVVRAFAFDSEYRPIPLPQRLGLAGP